MRRFSNKGDRGWKYAVSDGAAALSLLVYTESPCREDGLLPAVLHEHRRPDRSEGVGVSECEYLTGGVCEAYDLGTLPADRLWEEYAEPTFEQPESFWRALEDELRKRLDGARAYIVVREVDFEPSVILRVSRRHGDALSFCEDFTAVAIGRGFAWEPFVFAHEPRPRTVQPCPEGRRPDGWTTGLGDARLVIETWELQ